MNNKKEKIFVILVIHKKSTQYKQRQLMYGLYNFGRGEGVASNEMYGHYQLQKHHERKVKRNVIISSEYTIRNNGSVWFARPSVSAFSRVSKLCASVCETRH